MLSSYVFMGVFSSRLFHLWHNLQILTPFWDSSATMVLHFLSHSTIQLAELQCALLSCPSLPFLTEINSLFKLLYIICIQILWKGIAGIWKISGEGWGVWMLFPCIIYHYKSSFLARTFAMNVQNIILGVYPKNLKQTKKRLRVCVKG